MRCEEVQKRLVEYIEGQLEIAERAALREHLAECESCAAELAAFERTWLLLEDDGYEEPSPFYWTRFNAGLRERLHRGRWVGGDERWGRLVPRLATATVAIALFVVGVWVGLGPTQNAGAPPGAAPAIGVGRSFAEAPVISPRSKLLVQTGGMAEPLAHAADTLAPGSFNPFGESPRMMLASSEDRSAAQRPLEQWLAGN